MRQTLVCLFVCLSHSFWLSKQYPFSMFTLTNHTWPGKLRSRWHAEDNINNNNLAICCWCTKNVQQPWVFKFQLVTPIEKNMGKQKNTSQRNSISKKGKWGESVAAEMPKGETPQDALTDDVVSLRLMKWTHEIHWVGFTLLKVGKLAPWKIIPQIGSLSSFKTSSALFNFLFAGIGAWCFWLCGFLEILLLS